MEKVYFIILNYNTAQETMVCVESIRKLKGKFEKHIVIIDNCSTDDSLLKISKFCRGADDVEIYQMEENLGFSKANNYGYQITREREDVLFCIVCNSDIEFVQQDFLLQLKKEYMQSRFYVCGPNVFCPSKVHTVCKGYQSPMYPIEWMKGYVIAYRSYYDLKYRILRKEHFRGIKDTGLLLWWNCWKSLRKLLAGTCYNSYRRVRHENVPVHGSCIIVSREFMEREEKLFYPEVKFYGEELLLYLRCIRQEYKVVYEPRLLIYHMQGKSTSFIGNQKEKNLFCYKNFAMGAEKYLEELRNGNRK